MEGYKFLEIGSYGFKFSWGIILGVGVKVVKVRRVGVWYGLF